MLRPNAFRIFRARPVSYGTTERPMALQSQRDCILQPRVAESARLPWEEGSLAVNPNGVAASGEARWSQPLWGRGLRTMFTQGSSRLATLGFETESLRDSALEFPKGIGSNPGGIGPSCPPVGWLAHDCGQECPRSSHPCQQRWKNVSCAPPDRSVLPFGACADRNVPCR